MSELDFDFSVTRDEHGACRIVLRGELDLGSAELLGETLEDCSEDVLLDLRGLTFMDSTGVRLLLETAERRGPQLRVIPPESGDARVTMEETGIAPLLPLVDPGERARR